MNKGINRGERILDRAEYRAREAEQMRALAKIIPALKPLFDAIGKRFAAELRREMQRASR